MPDYNRRVEHFFDVIGRRDMFESGKFFPQMTMVDGGHIKECVDSIQAWFSDHTKDEIVKIFNEGDIPFSVCYTWQEIIEDPQANAVGAFYDCKCPNGNVVKVTHTPVRMDSEDDLGERTAPLIGEQGREILAEVGYSDAKIDAMLESGALYIWKEE